MPLGVEVGPIPGDFVFDGDPATPRKRAHPLLPNFGPCLLRQTGAWMKMPLGTEVGLRPGDFLLDGDPATPRKRTHPTPAQFLAYVYCGQTAGWMKTPLDTEVDLRTSHIVLDVAPAVLERSTAARLSIRPCLLWPRSPISATAELLLDLVIDAPG